MYFYEFCSAVMVIEYDTILPSWVVMCEGVGPIVVVSVDAVTHVKLVL